YLGCCPSAKTESTKKARRRPNARYNHYTTGMRVRRQSRSLSVIAAREIPVVDPAVFGDKQSCLSETTDMDKPYHMAVARLNAQDKPPAYAYAYARRGPRRA